MQNDTDATVIGAASAQDSDRTQAFNPQVERTQLGEMLDCPVCRARNLASETYCSECGFLLSSQPSESIGESVREAPVRLTDTRTHQSFQLWSGTYTVGRENADILLSDPSVSRRHAKIEIAQDRLSVTDLGSTNGSVVAGKRLDANAMSDAYDGDELRFGNCILKVSICAGEKIPAQTEDGGGESAVEPAEEPTDDQSSVLAGGAVVEPVRADVVAVLIEKQSGARHEVTVDGANIGRRAGNDIVIANPYVSSSHAQLVFSEGALTLTDVGSSNGTSVNGEKLAPNSPAVLDDGDIVSFGPVEVVVQFIVQAADESEEAQ